MKEPQKCVCQSIKGQRARTVPQSFGMELQHLHFHVWIPLTGINVWRFRLLMTQQPVRLNWMWKTRFSSAGEFWTPSVTIFCGFKKSEHYQTEHLCRILYELCMNLYELSFTTCSRVMRFLFKWVLLIQGRVFENKLFALKPSLTSLTSIQPLTHLSIAGYNILASAWKPFIVIAIILPLYQMNHRNNHLATRAASKLLFRPVGVINKRGKELSLISVSRLLWSCHLYIHLQTVADQQYSGVKGCKNTVKIMTQFVLAISKCVSKLFFSFFCILITNLRVTQHTVWNTLFDYFIF